MSIALVLLRNCTAIKPPIILPTTTHRFHWCSFQSKSKNELIFPAPPIEQIVRKLEDIPNVFPKETKRNITVAIKDPDTNQGQGFKI